MLIETNEIQIWSLSLILTPEQEKEQFVLLSKDERLRAQRFHFPIHKQKYIAARAALRQILSKYLDMPAQDIVFTYTEHKKPYLSSPHPLPLQFNLSHSHDIAIIACTLDYDLGIDIEKVESVYKEDVAKRFFSPQENEALGQLEGVERIQGFYRLWARKEAVIKAIGKGLFIPLQTFSVSIQDSEETITLENENWTLIPLIIHEDYQAALATNQPIKKISYCR